MKKTFVMLDMDVVKGHIEQDTNTREILISLSKFALPMRAMNNAHIGNLEDFVHSITKGKIAEIEIEMPSAPNSLYIFRFNGDGRICVMTPQGRCLYDTSLTKLVKVDGVELAWCEN